MGIYDRDYAADDRPAGFNLGGSRLMVTNIVLVTVGIYILQVLTRGPDGSPIEQFLALHLDLLQRPWQFYQLLTYGFVHSESDVLHVIFNMLILWFLGREVEAVYGGKTLLKFYLSTIFIGAVGWVALEYLIVAGQGVSLTDPNLRNHILLGASGGVVGVAMVFVLRDPHRTILFMFIVPMPIWLLAVIMIGFDVIRTFDRTSGVAASVHLIGAAMGYVFYRTQWHLGYLLPSSLSLERLKPRPKLRVHDPDDDIGDLPDKLAAEVDRILEKLGREGESSLTRKERKTLEEASRRYQRKNRH